MAAADVLDLLLVGESSEDGRALAVSILRSRKSLGGKAKQLVEALCSRSSERKEDLTLLVEALATCPPSILAQNFTNWLQALTNVLQATEDASVFQIGLRGVTVLVEQVCSCPEAMQELSSQQLSPLLHTLLNFRGVESALQVQLLRLVARCLLSFTSSCSQLRPPLKKWAASAALKPHPPLAQEGCRVLVLLCQHSNQQWSSLMECVLTGAEWTLSQLHYSSISTKSGRAGVPKALSSWLELPAPPTADPERTASLLQMLSQLGRLLRYCLLLPPGDSALPPSVPLERILALVSLGLKPAPAGHVLEARVLQVTQPVVHAVMWSVLGVLVTTCHTHLLPYAGHMTSLLTAALCTKEGVDQSVPLLTAVHHTLSAWVGVAKDMNNSSLGPLLRSLISSTSHAPLRHSSLEALVAVITSVGVLIAPASLASSVLQVAMAALTPSTPREEALLGLRLLLACAECGNASLRPPANTVLQLLTDLTNTHPSREVVELCLRSITTRFRPSTRPQPPSQPTNTHYIIPPPPTCSPHLAPPQSPPPAIQTTPQPSAAVAVPLSSELEINPHPLSGSTPTVAPPTGSSGKRKREGEMGEENSSRKRKVSGVEGAEGERQVQETEKMKERRELEEKVREETREEMRKAEEERRELEEKMREGVREAEEERRELAEEAREEMREAEEEMREEMREVEEEMREEMQEVEEEMGEVENAMREGFGEEWSDSDASGLEHFVADSPDDASDSLD